MVAGGIIQKRKIKCKSEIAQEYIPIAFLHQHDIIHIESIGMWILGLSKPHNKPVQ